MSCWFLQNPTVGGGGADLKNIFMSEHFTKSTSGHGTGSLRRGFTGFPNEFATELATSSPARLDPEHVGVGATPCGRRASVVSTGVYTSMYT